MAYINDDYIPAVLDGRIALITNLGRYFGKLNRSGIRKWKAEGLVIVVDDIHFTMIATYKKRLIAASLPNRLIFINDDWFDIIKGVQQKIREATAAAEQEQIRERGREMLRGGLN